MEFIFHGLGGWELKIKTPADSVSGRAALCFTDGILRLCPRMRDSKQVPCVLFYRVIIIPVLLGLLQKTDRIDSEGVYRLCIHDTVFTVDRLSLVFSQGWKPGTDIREEL